MDVKVKGVVKEVRWFDKSVILFLTASEPEKLCGKVVRFYVTGYSCLTPVDWVKLAVGTEVMITCCPNRSAGRFSLEVIKSEVIDANDFGF